VELHDCFTANELLTYEALGLTPEGTANSSSGMEAIPTGESGHEPFRRAALQRASSWRDRAWAMCRTHLAVTPAGGVRQVEGARLALQHNIGLGGACVVTLYQRQ